jgi:hypothetical protein
MSNYNAMYIGTRRSYDYTRTVAEFSFKQNTKPVVGNGYGTDPAVYIYNPYLWGSTVKKTLDDQGFKMGMSHNYGASLDQPRLDVSDPKESLASGMASFKNYPTEGWSSFGKKGDKAIEYAGSTWLRMPVS